EWNLAVNRMLDMADDQSFLLPVVIDDTPEMTARVPDRFRERQWTRLPGGLASGEFTARVARLLEADRTVAPTVSGVARRTAFADPSPSEEGFWVAVLPFKCAGSSAEVTALADALADEIVTGMSRFSYLKVIARTTTSRYASVAADARTVGREIGARYLMEGSLRQTGTRLRLTVQLVDATSGA